jgi:hypothetical protein
LALLLAEEVARRKQTRLQRCTRSAHFRSSRPSTSSTSRCSPRSGNP